MPDCTTTACPASHTSAASAWSISPPLPFSALQIPESVAEVSNHWVRFTSTEPPLVLEAAVQMQAVPADPAIWTLR